MVAASKMYEGLYQVSILRIISIFILPTTAAFILLYIAHSLNHGSEIFCRFSQALTLDEKAACAEHEDIRTAKAELSAVFKADIAVKVNDNFAYTSQLVLFSNYLDHPENIRVNWDNRFDWKIAKYFSLTLTTNMIYDDKVMIFSDKDGLTKQRVQFKESLLFGFTYTIARKR